MLNSGKWKQRIFTIAKPIIAVLLALAISGVIIMLLGLDPVSAVKALFLGAVSDASALGETTLKMVPLILTGLSFAVANRCGLVNIGAEGQLYMGGLCSMAVALYVTGLPAIIHLPLALLAGILGGGLWGAFAGWLKYRFNMNEIISTIMLNYIAIYTVNYMVTGPMIEPPGSAPRTAVAAITAQIPRIFSNNRMHYGIILALVGVLCYWFFMEKTRSGFEMKIVGFNANAAAYTGINKNRKIVSSMFLAGAFAGLAGGIELLAVQLRMYQNFGSGYGFDGIAVAMLGQNTPVGIVLSAFLFGALRSGANLMQMTAKVPSAIIEVIQALVIIFVIASNRFKLPKVWRRAKAKPVGQSEPERDVSLETADKGL